MRVRGMMTIELDQWSSRAGDSDRIGADDMRLRVHSLLGTSYSGASHCNGVIEARAASP